MILLVARSKYYSRGREQADAAIIGSVESLLRNNGYETRLIPETALCGDKTLFEPDNTPQVVLSMARNKDSLSALAALQYNGATVINPVTAVNLCRKRSKQWYILKFVNREKLKGAFFDSMEQLKDSWSIYPCWIKTDRKSRFVENVDRCPDLKGRLVVTEHIEGSVVKFYAVDSRIVGWFYVSAADSRFGEAVHNDLIHKYAFDMANLDSIVAYVAAKTGLMVFGGDVIVSPDGRLTLIDVNDWPSFGRFRETAANRIVELIKHYIDDGKEN